MKCKILLLFLLIACTFTVFAQKQTVRGVVKDSFLGETVVGANVLIKGTLTGAVTDIDGKFTLLLDKGNYTLEVSYVGYESTSQEIVVADKPHAFDHRLWTFFGGEQCNAFAVIFYVEL